MGFDVIIPGPDYTPAIIADRELYCDAERTTLLEAGEAGARFLIASHPGKEIGPEFAVPLGLVMHEGVVMQVAHVPVPAPAKEQKAAPVNKERKAPTANKAKAADPED